jgi:hypothetical protein
VNRLLALGANRRLVAGVFGTDQISVALRAGVLDLWHYASGSHRHSLGVIVPISEHFNTFVYLESSSKIGT